MKPIGHVLRYIEKTYPGIPIKEQEETKAHIFTDTESIWVSFEDGQIKENKRARRGTKQKTEVLPNNTDSTVSVSTNASKPTVMETSVYTKRPMPSIFKEGDLVENVYTGSRYTVVGIDENVLRVQDHSCEYNLYLVAAVDYMKIIQ